MYQIARGACIKKEDEQDEDEQDKDGQDMKEQDMNEQDVSEQGENEQGEIEGDKNGGGEIEGDENERDEMEEAAEKYREKTCLKIHLLRIFLPSGQGDSPGLSETQFDRNAQGCTKPWPDDNGGRRCKPRPQEDSCQVTDRISIASLHSISLTVGTTIAVREHAGIPTDAIELCRFETAQHHDQKDSAALNQYELSIWMRRSSYSMKQTCLLTLYVNS